MRQIEIEPGDRVVVTVGRKRVSVVSDQDGSVGVEDSTGAWLPPEPDSHVATFPVFEWADSLSDRASQVDDMIAELDGEEEEFDSERFTIVGLVKILYWLVGLHPLLPAMLIVKAFAPTSSTREIGKRVGLGRSQTSEMMRFVERACPRFFTLFTGSKANSKRGQRGRRKQEELRHLLPQVGSFRGD